MDVVFHEGAYIITPPSVAVVVGGVVEWVRKCGYHGDGTRKSFGKLIKRERKVGKVIIVVVGVVFVVVVGVVVTVVVGVVVAVGVCGGCCKHVVVVCCVKGERCCCSV